MKARLLILFLVIVGSQLASAQRFKGGFLAGFNASQVDGDTYSGYNKFGLMGGAYVYTSLSNMLDIQMEIKYMGKGAKKAPTDQDLHEYKSQLNYIEIPVLLRLNLKNKFGIEGGLGVGYLFSYSEEFDYAVVPSQHAAPFKPFELSGLIGLSYSISPRVLVNLRYSYSLLSIVNTVDVYNPNFWPRGVYNNLFTAGIYYNLGK